METGSLRDELFKSFDNTLDTPTASAFVQARNKIKLDAFKHIFNKFNDRTHEDILYKVCRLNMRFDYMSKEDPWYEFNCRTVRFKITEDTYECIITNLDRTKFSSRKEEKIYKAGDLYKSYSL